jgi:hypothetical protein
VSIPGGIREDHRSEHYPRLAAPGPAGPGAAPPSLMTEMPPQRLAGRAAQGRPVSRISEPGQAFPVDLDPGYPPAIGVGTVGAGVVHQDPPAVLGPEHGVLPGDAGIGDYDVALWVAADQVRTAARQAPVISLSPDH